MIATKKAKEEPLSTLAKKFPRSPSPLLEIHITSEPKKKKLVSTALANENPALPLSRAWARASAAPSIIPTPTPTIVRTNGQQHATQQHRHRHHHVGFKTHLPKSNHPLQSRFTIEFAPFLGRSTDIKEKGGGGGGGGGEGEGGGASGGG